MQDLIWFLVAYIWGGISFLPLIALATFFHAWYTFPVWKSTADWKEQVGSIVQPGDDTDALRRVQKTLGEKFQPRNDEADVAAQYFACVREWTPGMISLVTASAELFSKSH